MDWFDWQILDEIPSTENPASLAISQVRSDTEPVCCHSNFRTNHFPSCFNCIRARLFHPPQLQNLNKESSEVAYQCCRVISHPPKICTKQEEQLRPFSSPPPPRKWNALALKNKISLERAKQFDTQLAGHTGSCVGPCRQAETAGRSCLSVPTLPDG